MNQDVTICAVVPVAKMSGQLSNLESWLQSAIQNEIRVYLIHDIQDSLTGPELKTIVSLKNSPLVTLHEGRFGGPGLARNFGLELATEDWIFFWDADDLPDPKASKFMITRHMQDLTVDASILAGGFEIREKKSKKTLGYSPFSFNQQQNMQNLACHIGLWRCAFRRIDITHKFNFTRMGEDQYFLFQNLSSRKILFFAATPSSG
jgi:glycosyltransferase involved in cell wall biosynthesis